MENNKDQMPSLSEQGKNLAKFTFEVVQDAVALNGNPFVPKEKYQERLDLCNECEHFAKGSKRCRQCGCFMESRQSLLFPSARYKNGDYSLNQ